MNLKGKENINCNMLVKFGHKRDWCDFIVNFFNLSFAVEQPAIQTLVGWEIHIGKTSVVDLSLG